MFRYNMEMASSEIMKIDFKRLIEEVTTDEADERSGHNFRLSNFKTACFKANCLRRGIKSNAKMLERLMDAFSAACESTDGPLSKKQIEAFLKETD